MALRVRCPLEFADPAIPEEGDRDAIDARNGLWAFESFLAVGDDPADRVTLGEG